MTERRELTDTALDALFAEARAATPRPQADLVARILADAQAESDAMARAARTAPGPVKPRGFWAGLGGWPGFAGLATAGVAGLMIGFLAPDTVGTLSGGVIADRSDYDIVDFVPGFGAILDEG